MPDTVLDLLKLVLLVLLYLFFARVLWAVWSEVRQPATRAGSDYAPIPPTTRDATLPHAGPPSPAATAGAASDATSGRRSRRERDRIPRGKRRTPTQLYVLEPNERRGTTYRLADALTIGREPDNTITIDDAYLSGHHARIARSDERLLLVDLTSRNGTFLNGNRIDEPRRLEVGDRIQIGFTVFEVR